MLLGALLALLLTPASPILSVPKVEASPLTKSDLVAMASSTAAQYHLNADHFIKTIQCESQFVPDQIGDRGESHGIAQIFAPAHLDISIEQANDPAWALNWMGQQWANDNYQIWTCWRILYGRGY